MAKHLAKCPKCGEKLTYESSVGDRIQCASCGAVLKAPGKGAPSDPLIGQTLGEFEIRSLLGRGGMGSVYKARQESLGRDVAIKVLPEGLSKDAAFVARFRREARSAAAVRHPNIIEVFSVGEDRGHQYIAMEFIAGDTLGQILNRDERLDPARTLDLLKQTAAALSAAHETGVLHRDIKPGNILIDRRGLAKVADFGLAKRPDSDVNVTQTGSSLGTPLYMPPETCRGQEADARSDLYSLGATFYQALAGRPPFQGTSPTALIAQHLEDAPPKLKGLAPAASSALCRTIHKLLRKKPGERYQSADELLGILAKLDPKAKIATGEPRARRSAAGSPSRETRASRHPHDTPTSKKKSSAPFILGGVAAIVLAVVLVFALGGKNDEKPQAKVPPKKTQTPAPAKKVAPAPKKKSPTPPKQKAPPPPRDPKEREAVDFFARAQRTAKPGTWLSAEGYLAKLDRDYAKTKYYAANRAEIAALKAKVEAALKKPVPPKPPEAPATTPLPPPDAEGWISLFNGRTLAGRAPGDRRGNGRVVDGWLQVANTLGFFFDIRARDVEFRATMARTDGKAGGGLLLRADDESYYSALADPSGHCAIDRRADGRFTALIKGDAGRELGESFQLMASAIGDTITLYVDGKKVLETRDATLRAGRVGLRAFRGALRFKNVAVRVLDKAPAAPVAPPPPEPAAPKVDVGLAAALEPIDAKLAAWDFAGAAELVSKAALPPELLAQKKDEIARLAKLKVQIIKKINTVQPKWKKSHLLIPGINGDITKADDASITIKLPDNKTETVAWEDLKSRSVDRLLTRCTDRTKPDDWIATGLLALALDDAPRAESCFREAEKLGLTVGPYLAPLARAAFERVRTLLGEGRGAKTPRLQEEAFTGAKAALAALETKYGKTPWAASHRETIAAAARAVAEGQADALYGQAAEMHRSGRHFEVRTLIEKLKATHPDSRAVTDATRKPTVAAMAKAVATLGKRVTVAQNGRADFKTIQAAIKAVPPKSLIEIRGPATYRESIIIPREARDLTLRGAPGAWPILAGPTPLAVRARGTALEQLVVVSGKGPAIVCEQGASLRLRAAIVDGHGHESLGVVQRQYYNVEARNSVFTGTVRSWDKDGGVGKLVARDCLFLRGEVRTKHGMDLKNCLVSGIVHAYAPGGALIHQCTLTQLAHLDGAPNVVSDSIVSCVESTQPANVHHSDVFDKGFLLLAKQGEGCFKADPQFNDPKEFDFGLKKTSPCIGKATDGANLGVRYTPEMLEMLQKALELRKKGIIKF